MKVNTNQSRVKGAIPLERRSFVKVSGAKKIFPRGAELLDTAMILIIILNYVIN